MELLEGHLHVHLDLGTGPVNVRASRLPLNDGQWHHVELNLKRNMGRIAIDGADESFETPGMLSWKSHFMQACKLKSCSA